MSVRQSTDQGFEKQSYDEPADQLLSARKEASEDLPSPISAQTSRPKFKVSAAAIIPVWIVLSSTVILYNNHLYSTLNFRYPVFLVTWHLTFAVSLASRSSFMRLTRDRPLAPAFYNAPPISWMERRTSTLARTCLSAQSSLSASYSARA